MRRTSRRCGAVERVAERFTLERQVNQLIALVEEGFDERCKAVRD